MDLTSLLALFSLLVPLVHVLGLLQAFHALLTVRTAQGTIAWAISLITFPWLAIPLYWIFGRSKFNGYVEARRTGNSELRSIAEQLKETLKPFHIEQETIHQAGQAVERLARMPFTTGNSTRLLIDGEETFAHIFDTIDQAKEYILIEFFIIHDDVLGKKFKDHLIRKAQQGVHIYCLYDEVGSNKLPKLYINELKDAGIHVHRFLTTRGLRNRFQLNFRNHRKIIIADGQVAYVGGLNVGDEYMGWSKKFGHWRDTHLKIEGPSVQCVQLVFLEDWYWATRTIPELEWTPKPGKADRAILVFPSGPADILETCNLFFVQAIHSAKKRLWITSPYFVPDDSIIDALQLAALRGVDIRIMLPQKADHILPYLSAYSYLSLVKNEHIRIYRYEDGFMHQKVVLVDEMAAVGTANLDNRSLRLNFEMMLIVPEPEFANEVEAMLNEDFKRCRLVHHDEYESKNLLFKIAVRTARLMSPVQ